MAGGLGRRTPPNFTHVEKYPLRTLIADPQHMLAIPPDGTERSLGLPWWWKQHDQGQEGSCVGFGVSAMTSITNKLQRYQTTGQSVTYRYASRWLYGEAQLVDYWSDTPPAEGTSVDAGAKILHTVGHRRVQNGKTGPVMLEHGISAYRWAQNHNEVRAALYAGLAVAIGVNWYNSFWDADIVNNERWIDIPPGASVAGGHCVCIYRMSDRRDAFMFMNSWGPAYAPTWMGYETLNRLLNEYGEAVVITDR